MISKDLVDQHGLSLKTGRHEKLLTADDSALDVSGSTIFVINGVPIRALVSKSIKKDILLGWKDLIRLNIITSTFPKPMVDYIATVKQDEEKKIEEKRIEDEIKQLQLDFPDVLRDTLPDHPLKGPEMVIELRTDVKIKPRKATTCKEIPKHWEAEADKVIQELIDDNIIERVPIDEVSEWISPALFVPKEGGKGGLRLVTDFTKLNEYVKRPVHPFPSASEITRSIPAGTRYFCKMDALKGYHQVPLEENSRKLTTFLLPSGKYRYKKGPMGLTSTGDCWCHRSDQVIIGCKNCSKIVDDILATATNLDDLFKTIRKVLEGCRKHGLTLKRSKLKISSELKFAGYHLSPDGVSPDQEKVDAIRNFPTPKDVTGVRSFLGLANQLGGFLPDLAMATSTLRSLLKKGISFQWLAEHQEEFDFCKKLLTSPHLVHYFDPALPTSLLTDASKLHGLGYALIQHDATGKLRLIQAGSRSLIPAEERYAPIEQECLGAVWAMEKCRYYLLGCPSFKLVTDHQPLKGIFAKELGEISNRRLQRFRERVVDYSFQTEWVEGKTHYIADALSRNPVGTEEDPRAYYVAASLRHLDPKLDDLRRAAQECPTYQRLLSAVKTLSSADLKKLPATDPAHAYKQVWDHLSLHEDGQLVLFETDRIVIPTSARQSILDKLHAGHTGMTKTKKLAQQLYYWPNMGNDIKTAIQGCSACIEHLPMPPPEPLQQTIADYPLQHTSADLLSYAGQSYLVYADRFSGMIWVERLRKVTTEAVTTQLTRWMEDFGFPLHIRTDGGPQFRGPFEEWCKEFNIKHQLTSPYNPRANGHAENSVKSAKLLLSKLEGNMRQFRSHLYAWRNTPRSDGLSPTDLFFGFR